MSEEVEQRPGQIFSGDLPQLLSMAKQANCDHNAQWQISEAIVHHFSGDDHLQSRNPLDLMETLKLAYRLRHHRLIDLVDCVCIQRFQERLRRLDWDLSAQTAYIPATSMAQWKVGLDYRTDAIVNLLNDFKWEDQIGGMQDVLNFTRAVRSGQYYIVLPHRE